MHSRLHPQCSNIIVCCSVGFIVTNCDQLKSLKTARDNYHAHDMINGVCNRYLDSSYTRKLSSIGDRGQIDRVKVGVRVRVRVGVRSGCTKLS